MPEPLKNLYTPELINKLANDVKGQFAPFDAEGFIENVLDEQWPEKELKQRMMHISQSLFEYLPISYPEALKVLKTIAPNGSGFEYMFFPGFVELFGLEQYDESINALEAFTPYSSSELAIRPFIIKYGEQVMAQMLAWADSDNYHVRRLASEGCRPRLPWAIALPEFQKDPALILPILERLKHDDSEYVRRSVANNLNYIAKDHPELVVSIAQSWLGHSNETDWLVKHGCRTLLKQGHPEVLALFGFSKPDGVELKEFVCQPHVNQGERVEFSFQVTTLQAQLGKIRLEYAIDFMKKNGKHSRKVFKISESEVTAKSKQVVKSHSFKKITTRVYYPGEHMVSIIVNGVSLASLPFELK